MRLRKRSAISPRKKEWNVVAYAHSTEIPVLGAKYKRAQGASLI
jgi:hypothetical protein